MKLEGKVALVAGGSSGIGRATALAFAAEGAKVVIAARRLEAGQEVEAQIKERGGEATFIQTDVSKAAEVENLVRQTVEIYGRLDCAFNNAASLGKFSLMAELSEEDFDREVSLNLKSVWLCLKYEIAQMLRQQPVGGSIVNTSSLNGLGGVPKSSFYAVAKSGVLALTKSAALEYATQNIRVNALVAGAFRTPMLEEVFETNSAGNSEVRQQIVQHYEQLIPQRRIGRPEEAAEVVTWLCSEAASYVTGHSMIVDGGMSASFR
jgi:NAD(P)-dependent dehydrogenase (short-subunit alcohol dehydrogenase family)